MKPLFYLSIAFNLLLISCNSSDSSSPAPAGISPNQNTASEKYEYDFTYIIMGPAGDTFNDGKCSSGEHKFNSLPDYCEGLQSWTLNNEGCAVEDRKKLYLKDCGSNFEEVNFWPLMVLYFDKDLNKQCETTNDVVKKYGKNFLRTRAEFCDHLKDTNVFVSCPAFQQRTTLYKRANCEGSL